MSWNEGRRVTDDEFGVAVGRLAVGAKERIGDFVPDFGADGIIEFEGDCKDTGRSFFLLKPPPEPTVLLRDSLGGASVMVSCGVGGFRA